MARSAGLALALIAVATAAQGGEGADEAAIRRALTGWADAFNASNGERVCELFAPDLVAVYQGVTDRGFSELCAHLHSVLADADRRYSYTLDVKEILVSGDLAAARLVWTLEVRDRDGAVVHTTQEPSLDLFRRQPDGGWKIARFLAFDANGP
jgi:uncharacterized protein (TIGR02246 family)